MKRFVFFIICSLVAFSSYPQAKLEWLAGASSTLAFDSSSVSVVKADALGNIYYAGYFKGTYDVDAGAGQTLIASTTIPKVFIAKNNKFGVNQWAVVTDIALKKLTDLSILAIDVDRTGNVYLTGTFINAFDFNPDPLVNEILTPSGGASTQNDVFLMSFSGNGAYRWTKQIGGTGNDAGQALSIDGSNNVYLGISFGSTSIDLDPGQGSTIVSTAGALDGALLKFDSTGVFKWAKAFGGTSNERVQGMVLKGSWVYLTGYFTGTVDFNTNAGQVNNLVTVSATRRDAFLSKYDTSGTFIWAKKIGNNTLEEEGLKVGIDKDNDLYVMGAFRGNNVDFDPLLGGTHLLSAGTTNNRDTFLAKYDSAGVFKWASLAVVENQDKGNANTYGLAIDRNKNVYLSGKLEGNIVFDQVSKKVYTPIGGQGGDVYVVKYNTNGQYQALVQVGGSAITDQALDVAVYDSLVVIVGDLSQKPDFDLSPGISQLGLNGSVRGWYVAAYTFDCIQPVQTAFLQPESACEQTIVSFNTVTATGTSPLHYVWRKNGVYIDTTLTGSFSINAVTAADSGLYRVLVFNACGQVDSSSASQNLSVFLKPNILSFTPSFSLCEGAPLLMTSVTTGTEPIAYEWTKDTQVLNNSTTTYSVSSAQATDGGNYRLKASNGCGTVNSSFSQVTVDLKPSISTFTPSTSICEMGTIILAVTATGKSPLNYQWKKGINTLSETTSQLSISNAQLSDGGEYSVSVVNTCGSAQSAISTLTVDVCTGTSDHEQFTAIDVYPNPSKGLLHVRLADQSTGLAYLYDAKGNLLKNEKTIVNGSIVDLSAYNSGVYFLRVQTHDTVQMIKIVKE